MNQTSSPEEPFEEKGPRFSGMSTAQLEHLIGASTKQLETMLPGDSNQNTVVENLTDIRAALTARRANLDEDDPETGSLEVMLTEIDVALETYNFFLLTGERHPVSDSSELE